MENQVRALHIAECKITRVDGGRLGFEVSRLLAATLDHRPRATCVYYSVRVRRSITAKMVNNCEAKSD